MKKTLIIAAVVLVAVYLAVSGVMFTAGNPVNAPAEQENTGKDTVTAPEPGQKTQEETGTGENQSGDEADVPQEPPVSEGVDQGEGQQANSGLQPVAVKGIYATGHTAGSRRIDQLIELIDRTELNALVVDIKDATGYLTTPLELETDLDIDPGSEKIKDLPGLLQKLKEHDIYAIARIVVFKDPLLAKHYPELAVQRRSGGTWYDYKGKAWTNPYKKEVWDYNVAIALAAAKAGFQEIQFDYVRFPSDGPLKEAVYPGKTDKAKAQVIADFLAYARQKLEGTGVFLSADVFGLTCSAKDDLGIGQKLELIAQNTDYVSPMVYPSHYAAGSYGLKNPNASPYRTVYESLTDAVYKTRDINSVIRPWLQDFSYGYPYGPEEVRAQIRATYDAGLKEWILWNPSNRYTEAALEPGN
ncbi:MAG: putative glycoside hydrolase [Thermoanaerobacteraceae bacterium]|nr:putative glycoside hydrolase [Thermoanaerobacteraceae bacterium]